MRNFLPIPFAPYNGAFSSRPFRLSGDNIVVSALVAWATYTANGATLGTTNSQLNVQMDLNAAASNTVSLNWLIRSVYIDNLGVNFPVYVYFPFTAFCVVAPPNSAGWYQVQATDRRAWIIAENMTDVAIAGLPVTNVLFTDAIVNSDSDLEAPTAVMQGLQSPLITVGGTGGQISSIAITNPGQWATSNALTVSGGGGSGASAAGSRNAYGQFYAVAFNPGAGFTGTPSVTYGGGFAVPSIWNNATNYPINQFVSWTNGFVYQCIQTGNTGVPPTGNAFSGTFWINTGITSQPIAPVFTATIQPITAGGSFANSGLYGSEALGDQTFFVYDNLNSAGKFHDNVFGSPYASGFIYITHLKVTALQRTASTAWKWNLQDQDGNIIIPFQVFLATAGQENLPYDVANIQKMNMKIPANRTYNLTATNTVSSLIVSHQFTYTYSNT